MANRDLHRVAIVGAYNTAQARFLEGETSFSVTLDAVRGAIADAGLEASDIDGLNIRTGTGGDPMSQRSWVHQLGGRPAWTGNAHMGVPAVLEAAAAIAAGYCSTVVIANGQAGAYTERASTAPWTAPRTSSWSASGSIRRPSSRSSRSATCTSTARSRSTSPRSPRRSARTAG